MAPATGLDGGKDPPGTPWRVDQFRRFRDLISPSRNIPLTTPPSMQIAITSINMSSPPLYVVAAETVTATLDDQEEVVFVADDEVHPPHASSTSPTDIQEDDVDIVPPIPVPSLLPSQSQVFPPATIIAANIISEHPLVSSTSSDLLSVVSRGSQDPDGNSSASLAAVAVAAVV